MTFIIRAAPPPPPPPIPDALAATAEEAGAAVTAALLAGSPSACASLEGYVADAPAGGSYVGGQEVVTRMAPIEGDLPAGYGGAITAFMWLDITPADAGQEHGPVLQIRTRHQTATLPDAPHRGVRLWQQGEGAFALQVEGYGTSMMTTAQSVAPGGSGHVPLFVTYDVAQDRASAYAIAEWDTSPYLLHLGDVMGMGAGVPYTLLAGAIDPNGWAVRISQIALWKRALDMAEILPLFASVQRPSEMGGDDEWDAVAVAPGADWASFRGDAVLAVPAEAVVEPAGF